MSCLIKYTPILLENYNRMDRIVFSKFGAQTALHHFVCFV